MTTPFNALLIEKEDKKVSASLRQISLAELPDEEVLVDVAYSTVNYKDGLATTGTLPICRKFPMVGGIDLSGTVVESKNPAFKSGDRVLVNGFGLSERYWGGYAQKQRLKAEWLVRVPDAFSLEEAMAIGTAGYTAMLCVLAIQDWGLVPEDGPVVVTGAAGGVGTVAIMLLAKLGYEVTASTGRVEEARALLEALGAKHIIARDELAHDPAPLEAETWAGAVDTVGDNTLATVLAQTRYEGIVTACGLAGSTNLPASVMPFILRGVTLRGIDSVMAPIERRQRAWDALAKLVDLDLLRQIYTVEPLGKVPELATDILAGKIKGRVVIDVNA
ncbi:MAG: oxidoreductase [Gammaproteobacteria bacterium]|nr:oxidoreductase [Gammaproteobacteria bacterium]MBQ0838525.1 oxidoreductase [Gammaproteobacteria bacterium]